MSVLGGDVRGLRFNSGQIIVVQSETKTINGTNDLFNKKVSIQVRNVDEDEVASWGAQIFQFEDLDSAVKLLLDEGTDAVVMGYTRALQYNDQYPGEIKMVGELFYVIPLVIVFCDSSPDKDLLSKINEALGEIKIDGSLQNLTDKWFESD
ncbi:MAG: transporter substrate-binding domain-containing protein [Chloroflexota bacterium]|nr:transporter substrate-binding domain-containing protein [Chloroflexota bacterium]